MKIVSKSLKETRDIAKDYIEKELKADKDQSLVVCLSGDLGSGKTAFTQETCRILGVEDPVTSPTFVLQKKYKINHPEFNELVHIDAYRLNDGEELKRIGWKELLTNPKRVVFIEWPEIVADVLTGKEKKIGFKFVSENEREINY
ncbi:MAG: tRNA (adenosine(37)-N6)-threonylcarbamoyltransferase complex ATPase subunit type 1 TsaE [Minisyncoccia bacterium]